MNLRVDVFLALVAVVSADGAISAEERTGLLQAAHAAGLSPEELGAVERALAAPAQPSDEAKDWHATLTEEERVFVYSAAMWLACVDGIISNAEAATVEKIGDKLRLSDKERAVAKLAAASFASDRRDVLGLARAIATHGQYF